MARDGNYNLETLGVWPAEKYELGDRVLLALLHENEPQSDRARRFAVVDRVHDALRLAVAR